jgi:hypothetical protein
MNRITDKLFGFKLCHGYINGSKFYPKKSKRITTYIDRLRCVVRVYRDRKDILLIIV